MKHTIRVIIFLCLATGLANAQQIGIQTSGLQYYRPNDMRGLNIFETPKDDTTTFKGTFIHIGGSFADDWQSLTDHNYTNPASKTLTKADSANLLDPIGGGFQLG